MKEALLLFISLSISLSTLVRRWGQGKERKEGFHPLCRQVIPPHFQHESICPSTFITLLEYAGVV
jgi:hypothetical protein